MTFHWQNCKRKGVLHKKYRVVKCIMYEVEGEEMLMGNLHQSQHHGPPGSRTYSYGFLYVIISLKLFFYFYTNLFLMNFKSKMKNHT